jgi:hypothetical protein
MTGEGANNTFSMLAHRLCTQSASWWRMRPAMMSVARL